MSQTETADIQQNNLKNWTLNYDENNIAWLALDKENSGTNVLSQVVLREFEYCLEKFENQPPNGVIIRSKKASGFIAGADIKEFIQLDDEQQALQYIRYAQGLFDRLENLSCPTLALIDGFCLGGGLELALACQYRIACDDEQSKTLIGLPEIKLGIHPGYGGSVRLIRLLGPLAAMNLMLTGSALSARAAKKIGVIDYAVPSRHLLAAGSQIILEKPKAKKAGFFPSMLNTGPIKSVVAKILKNKVAKKAKPQHYPAPYALIDLWLKFDKNHDVMMTQEARSVAKLMSTETAKNLVRVFFLQEKLKQQGKNSDFQAKRVHVIGAGVMGGDIAAWCAYKGIQVTLQDQSPDKISPAIKRAAKLFQKKLKQPRLVQQAMDRLVPDINGFGVKSADVVIEAIFENTQAKQALYQQVEPIMKKDALLVTNTSSIPIDDLCIVLQNPSRLVGLHFFNPVAMMQLIEIVAGQQSDPQQVNAAAAFARQLSRLPLPVKSTPGFLVNRILMPYLLEAVELLSEGTSAEVIDQVALDFGMPMGPVELADTVGLDVCLSVAEVLTQRLGGSVPELLRKKTEANELGKKNGKGFYVYKNNKPSKLGSTVDKAKRLTIEKRLISRLLNEAITCLREEVVSEADLLDAGIIFGTGFAPFRGGPIHYAEKLGFEAQIKQFQELEQTYGPRFHPDDGWSCIKKAS